MERLEWGHDMLSSIGKSISQPINFHLFLLMLSVPSQMQAPSGWAIIALLSGATSSTTPSIVPCIKRQRGQRLETSIFQRLWVNIASRDQDRREVQVLAVQSRTSINDCMLHPFMHAASIYACCIHLRMLPVLPGRGVRLVCGLQLWDDRSRPLE